MRFNRLSVVALLLASAGPSLLATRVARAQNAAAKDDDDDDLAPPPPKHHDDAADKDDDDEKAPPPKLDQASLDAAKAALVKYLDAVKSKKWREARELTHPLTLKLIEQVKKRLGEERHSMAPWYWAKDNFYLTSYKIDGVDAAAHGSVVVKTVEDSFQVQEKGEYQGEKAAYLVGKKNGRWFVIDKKSEADGFTNDSLNYGYPGYFDDK
ncbi:MAG TPA: hypothetical protein VMB50_04205 [Myxococcales bacterium]|jgi:hypothetical protein|nr:hypothetical protein [Myxococcales bacterium]